MQGRSGKQMQGGSGKETQWGSGMARQSEDVKYERHAKFWHTMLSKHLQNEMSTRKSNTEGLVDALSRHLEVLRRDTSFLRREVAFRDLSTVDGKRSYLEKTQSNSEQPQSVKQKSELWFEPHKFIQSDQKIESSESKVKFPYLVNNKEEALDFLLHESLELCNRIQSLASVVSEFNIPISPERVNMLLLMSHTLNFISRHIVRSDGFKSREEKNAISCEEKKTATIPSYNMHRAGWKSRWGSGTPNCGFFGDITTLSPMKFTHYPPGLFPYYGTTCPALQIYFIKIVELNANLDWPLRIYGVVAARDDVDHNRNILFSRPRHNYQVLTENEPFLCLTGPSRAIVAVEPVTFEVDLKIMYGAMFQHTAVLRCNYRYWSAYDDMPEIGRGCCTVQLSHEQLGTAVQATIVGIHLDHPLEGGCKVFCFSSAAAKITENPKRQKVVLLHRHDEVPLGSDHFIQLSRNVVTAELNGTLRVCIVAFSKAGITSAARGYVDIPVQHCQTSVGVFSVGASRVKVMVAWSVLVPDKENLMLEGCNPL